jgi:hypothetical protein
MPNPANGRIREQIRGDQCVEIKSGMRNANGGPTQIFFPSLHFCSSPRISFRFLSRNLCCFFIIRIHKISLGILRFTRIGFPPEKARTPTYNRQSTGYVFRALGKLNELCNKVACEVSAMALVAVSKGGWTRPVCDESKWQDRQQSSNH